MNGLNRRCGVPKLKNDNCYLQKDCFGFNTQYCNPNSCGTLGNNMRIITIKPIGETHTTYEWLRGEKWRA